MNIQSPISIHRNGTPLEIFTRTQVRYLAITYSHIYALQVLPTGPSSVSPWGISGSPMACCIRHIARPPPHGSAIFCLHLAAPAAQNAPKMQAGVPRKPCPIRPISLQDVFCFKFQGTMIPPVWDNSLAWRHFCLFSGLSNGEQ